jgi:hypothetical protein
MSLYRQAGRGRARSVGLATVLALLVGVAIGFAFGRSSAGDPSAREVLERVGAELRPVHDGLGLIPNEYSQAYRGQGAESSGVRGALARIDEQIGKAAKDLEVLDPASTRALKQRIAALRAAVERKRPPAEVARLAREAEAALRAVPGGS